ncbi:MAG: hypothetical protein ABIS31_01830, partial [Candidatus Eisenbacteria bacterium]
GSLPDTCRSNHRLDWDRLLLARVEADSLAAIFDSLASGSLRPLHRPGAPFKPGYSVPDSTASR